MSRGKDAAVVGPAGRDEGEEEVRRVGKINGRLVGGKGRRLLGDILPAETILGEPGSCAAGV